MKDQAHKLWFSGTPAGIELLKEIEDEDLNRAIEEIEAEEQGGCSICLSVPMTTLCNNAGCDK